MQLCNKKTVTVRALVLHLPKECIFQEYQNFFLQHEGHAITLGLTCRLTTAAEDKVIDPEFEEDREDDSPEYANILICFPAINLIGKGSANFLQNVWDFPKFTEYSLTQFLDRAGQRDLKNWLTKLYGNTFFALLPVDYSVSTDFTLPTDDKEKGC